MPPAEHRELDRSTQSAGSGPWPRLQILQVRSRETDATTAAVGAPPPMCSPVTGNVCCDLRQE